MHLGTHWFNRNAITNIISLADTSEMFRVTMNTKIEKALIVHMDDKKVKFSQMPGGLYARKPEENSYSEENSNKKKDDENIKLKDTQQSYLQLKTTINFYPIDKLRKHKRFKDFETR